MSVLPESPDERPTLQMVARLKAGDDGAWTQLYDLYHDELLFAIRVGMGQRLRSALHSEDVLQSVALEAFRALPRFEDRGAGSLRALLHRLVRSKLADRGRWVQARKRSGAVPLTPSIAEQVADEHGHPTYRDQARFGRLEQAMAQLPADMREVLVLRRIEGLSSKEAAARLGRSDAAVRKLYSRAIARLTGLVEARGADED